MKHFSIESMDFVMEYVGYKLAVVIAQPNQDGTRFYTALQFANQEEAESLPPHFANCGIEEIYDFLSYLFALNRELFDLEEDGQKAIILSAIGDKTMETRDQLDGLLKELTTKSEPSDSDECMFCGSDLVTIEGLGTMCSNPGCPSYTTQMSSQMSLNL